MQWAWVVWQWRSAQQPWRRMSGSKRFLDSEVRWNPVQDAHRDAVFSVVRYLQGKPAPEQKELSAETISEHATYAYFRRWEPDLRKAILQRELEDLSAYAGDRINSWKRLSKGKLGASDAQRIEALGEYWIIGVHKWYSRAMWGLMLGAGFSLHWALGFSEKGLSGISLIWAATFLTMVIVNENLSSIAVETNVGRRLWWSYFVRNRAATHRKQSPRKAAVEAWKSVKRELDQCPWA